MAHIRSVTRFTAANETDAALGEFDNFIEKLPLDPLANRITTITTSMPPLNSAVVTFAYPENATREWGPGTPPFNLFCDYFSGKVTAHIGPRERPFLKYAHLETSVRIRGGASGGPVYDEKGRVVGVASRGWDFDGSEHEGDELSSVTPISEFLGVALPKLKIPKHSWEYAQLPPDWSDRPTSVSDLIRFQHIRFQL